MGQKVAILGASNRADRYSNIAFHLLREFGHETFPVSPALKELEGVKAFTKLEDVPQPVDTLTMYIGPAHSDQIRDSILNFKTKRVIFNPGTENPGLEAELRKRRIEVVIGCTLVMLRTNQF